MDTLGEDRIRGRIVLLATPFWNNGWRRKHGARSCPLPG
jgi:hypothetical protein